MLEDRCGRKHDVGVACRRRPDGVGDDHRFGLLPGARELRRVGLMCERIAARPHHELHFRIGDLAAVEVDRLSGMKEALNEARNRNRVAALPGERRGLDGLHGTRNAAQDRPRRHGGAAARILVVGADAPARKTDLPERRREREAHPVGLLAVLNALDAPAHHDHRAVLAEVVRKPPDDVRFDARLFLGPLGRLFNAVAAAEHIVEEEPPARGVLLKKRRVGRARLHELVNHAEHEGAVGAWAWRNPFGTQELARVGCNRIDGISFDPLVFELPDGVRAFVKRREPVNVVRHDRIGAPEHNALRVLEHHIPGC